MNNYINNQHFIFNVKLKFLRILSMIDLRHWKTVSLMGQPIAGLTFFRAIKVTASRTIVICTITTFDTLAIWTANK